jgi:hypothetical protein
MSATNTGADKRAHSKVQLLNGSIDVLEGVDEVTQAITNDDSFPRLGYLIGLLQAPIEDES